MLSAVLYSELRRLWGMLKPTGTILEVMGRQRRAMLFMVMMMILII